MITFCLCINKTKNLSFFLDDCTLHIQRAFQQPQLLIVFKPHVVHFISCSNSKLLWGGRLKCFAEYIHVTTSATRKLHKFVMIFVMRACNLPKGLWVRLWWFYQCLPSKLNFTVGVPTPQQGKIVSSVFFLLLLYMQIGVYFKRFYMQESGNRPVS